MKIPKYVQELMKRAKYNYHIDDTDETAIGYTINIFKCSEYQQIDSFIREIQRLKNWVEKQGGDIYINHLPVKTHYFNQFATVTIFDPVMQKIESFIKE